MNTRHSVRQVRLEVPVFTELHECFVKAGFLLQVFPFLLKAPRDTAQRGSLVGDVSLIPYRGMQSAGCGVDVVKKNHEDICVRGSVYCVLVSEGSGMMEAQHHSRIITIMRGTFC